MCHVRIGKYCSDKSSRLTIGLTSNKVRVGHDALMGEVIRIEADRATIQVYEETGNPDSQDGVTEEADSLKLV